MIILCFDGALLNTYEVAFPIMKEHNVKGVLFVPTNVVRVDSHKEHMNIEQIREMHNAGWEIGSNSHSRPRFDKLHIDRAKWELTISKMRLEHWGFKPVSFAFPNCPNYTEEQVKLAQKIYKYVRTIHDFKHPNEKLIHGLPLDHGYPPIPGFLAGECMVYVLHKIEKPNDFEEWLERKHTVTFKEAGDELW